jgi:energy-coupling factor transport system substrate-specific component
MDKKIISVKTVVATGIGAVLMFVLMRFVAVPTGVPNTTINLGIAVLSVFAAIFGPVAGFLIGFIGHTLVDYTAGWGIWWTWIVANALYGFAVGFFWKMYKIDEGGFGLNRALIFNGIQIAANAIAWIVIAPTLDILIYREPASKVYVQGLVAAAFNIAVVLVLGSILIFAYAKTRTKTGSRRYH